MGQTSRARADRAGRSLHSACKSRDADDERRHGVDDGRPAHFRLPVRQVSRIARPVDLGRRARAHDRLRRGRRRVLVARSGERRAFRPGTGLRSGCGRRLRNGSDHLGGGHERDRRRTSGDRLDDALDPCACAGRARVREASAARSRLPDSARAGARNGRARRLQHGPRLLCLFPAGARRGGDLRQPQQLYRACDRRRRRSGRARRTDSALGLGGTGPRARRRRAYRAGGAFSKSALRLAWKRPAPGPVEP